MAGTIQRPHAMAALIIGIMELVFGFIIIICSFVLGGKTNLSLTLTPYWAGIPYAIPGILGIVVGATKNNCAMVAFMVLNIICFIVNGIASILIFLGIGIFASVASELTSNCRYSNGYCRCMYKNTPYNYKVDTCDALKVIVGLMWAVAIFALIAALTTLAGSIVGCIATCCSRNQQPGVVVIQQGGVPMHQPQQAPPVYK